MQGRLPQCRAVCTMKGRQEWLFVMANVAISQGTQNWHPNCTADGLGWPQRVHQSTRVVSIAGGCASSSSQQRCAWRVAAWLAISRVFLSRVPPSGDRDYCPVMCRRPGSSEVSLRPRRQRSFARSSDVNRVQSGATVVEDSHPRAAQVAS